MSRSLLFAFPVIACALGCQGQSNPFMRTTVPPPATGVGAPSDPYYNNSGSSQSAPVSSSAPVLGPTPTAPVVPPPDKRFTQPGGFNFPQGSVIHRKAIDPTSDDYRTGTTTIARASRPRSMLGGDSQTLIAKADSKQESASSDSPNDASNEVVLASASESLSSGPATEANAEQSRAAIVPNDSSPGPESETNAADTAMEAAADEPSRSTVRIVAEEESTSGAAENAEIATTPSDARSPFSAEAETSSSLAVAPPTASSTAPTEATLAATAGDSASEAAGRAKFYFDRKHESHPTKAQPVAYLGNVANDVAFSDGAAGNGGIDGEPGGASAYSYHSKYQWLRGKLEYSSTANRWKLRYIPIDGTTDQFGGSVVLPSSSLLDGMHAGEMVTARGIIGDTPAEHGRFAPLYQLSALERQ